MEGNSDTTAVIHASKGEEILVDWENYEALSKRKWCLNDGYAVTSARGKRGQPLVYMHKLVAGTGAGQRVDHINNSKLDNRAANLRLCSNAQNCRNVPLRKDNTSGFKGVTWDKARNKWQAAIKPNGRTITIGRYDTKEEAALAYNNAARLHFGEYAWLNPVPSVPFILPEE